MKPIVVKIGGSTLGAHDTAVEDIAALHTADRAVVVVHGGGNAATEWLTLHGVASEFVDGLRVTSAEAIDVVAAVFAGLVNKGLVAHLNACGARAFGLCGVDGGLIATVQADPRLGFVGRVKCIDPKPVEVLLAAGFLLVIAPLAFWADDPRRLMNVNADTIAGELAAVLGAERLVILTDVAGVKDENGKVVDELSPASAKQLIHGRVASGGMVPKLEACIRAAEAGVQAQILDGRAPHALRATLAGAVAGTTIA